MGRILLWVSALAIIVISFLGLFTWGLFFLPASVLLILAAFGVREGTGRVGREGGRYPADDALY